MLRHFNDLRVFASLPDELLVTLPDNLLCQLDFLADLIGVPVEQTSKDQFRSAYEILCSLYNLLKLFDQEIDHDFMVTDVGQLLYTAYEWYQRARAKHLNLSLMDVWDFIDPAQPDSLVTKPNCTFEAIWWLPLPLMDIEILKRTYGVELLDDPFEPEDIPASLSVRFTIFPLPFELT